MENNNDYFTELDNFRKAIKSTFQQYEYEIFKESCYFVISIFNFKQYTKNNKSNSNSDEFCNFCDMIFQKYNYSFNNIEDYNNCINLRQNLYARVINGTEFPLGFIFQRQVSNDISKNISGKLILEFADVVAYIIAHNGNFNQSDFNKSLGINSDFPMLNAMMFSLSILNFGNNIFEI